LYNTFFNDVDFSDRDDVTFGMIGKSDVFSMGVSMLFVTEGTRPYIIPSEMQRNFVGYCKNLDDLRAKFRTRMCYAATHFYKHDYSPKLPSCRNIIQISRAASLVIAEMCQAKVSQRPTALECLAHFHRFNQIDHPEKPNVKQQMVVAYAQDSRNMSYSLRERNLTYDVTPANFENATISDSNDFVESSQMPESSMPIGVVDANTYSGNQTQSNASGETESTLMDNECSLDALGMKFRPSAQHLATPQHAQASLYSIIGTGSALEANLHPSSQHRATQQHAQTNMCSIVVKGSVL
jgi:hypothetical protein